MRASMFTAISVLAGFALGQANVNKEAHGVLKDAVAHEVIRGIATCLPTTTVTVTETICSTAVGTPPAGPSSVVPPPPSATGTPPMASESMTTPAIGTSVSTATGSVGTVITTEIHSSPALSTGTPTASGSSGTPPSDTPTETPTSGASVAGIKKGIYPLGVIAAVFAMV